MLEDLTDEPRSAAGLDRDVVPAEASGLDAVGRVAVVAVAVASGVVETVAVELDGHPELAVPRVGASPGKTLLPTGLRQPVRTLHPVDEMMFEDRLHPVGSTSDSRGEHGAMRNTLATLQRRSSPGRHDGGAHDVEGEGQGVCFGQVSAHIDESIGHVNERWGTASGLSDADAAQVILTEHTPIPRGKGPFSGPHHDVSGEATGVDAHPFQRERMPPAER